MFRNTASKFANMGMSRRMGGCTGEFLATVAEGCDLVVFLYNTVT